MKLLFTSTAALLILGACTPLPNGQYPDWQRPVSHESAGSLGSDIQTKGPRLECRQHRWDDCDDSREPADVVEPPEPPEPPQCKGYCPPPPPPPCEYCDDKPKKPNSGPGNGSEGDPDVDPGESGEHNEAGD